MKPFSDPRRTLGNLDAGAAAALVAASADIALILDEFGVIRDVAYQNDELATALDGPASWLGHALADTVVIDSRGKAALLLEEAKAGPRQRHLNHASAAGPAVPILYSALRVGEHGSVVALGRDLRGMAALQQQLVDAQQSIEREYARLRDMELRYRLIFQSTTEAALVVDAADHAVLDANPAAREALAPGARVGGQDATILFTPETAPQVRTLLNIVRAAGQSDSTEAILAHDRVPVRVAASLFRENTRPLLLVRFAVVGPELPDTGESRLLKLVEHGPDGFVVTDDANRVLHANAAFLAMAGLAAESQAREQPLERWLGRSGVDLDVLAANLRQRGSVKLFATVMRDEAGATTDVEVSAVAVMNGKHPFHGYAIRNVGARVRPSATAAERELPRSVEQLSELIGRVPLRDLVREATDVIERLAIEAALELSGDNRASAAEMLGLSRQSLYVKMRRYGLGDLADSEAGR